MGNISLENRCFKSFPRLTRNAEKHGDTEVHMVPKASFLGDQKLQKFHFMNDLQSNEC